jgi:arylsulfatase A-like enzyme
VIRVGHGRRRRSRVAAVLAIIAAVAAIAGIACLAAVSALSRRDSPLENWRRVDLAVEPPAFGVEDWQPVMTELGRTADWPTEPANVTARHPAAGAGQVRAVVLHAGERLAWDVLGQGISGQAINDQTGTTWLQFTPLDARGPLEFVVESERASGEHTELLAIPGAPLHGPAPAPQTVDLPRDAARLWLSARRRPDVAPSKPAAPEAEFLVWGSPSLFVSRGPAPVTSSDQDGQPNLLLIGVDTLRADAVGAFDRSGRASVTPNLDRLAADSDVWENAHSAANATNPSFASVFTGLSVGRHGVTDLRTELRPEVRTLAECLRDAGYATSAIVAARHLEAGRSGLGQGFDTYISPNTTSAGEMAVDTAISELERLAAAPRQPFFLWLHLFDPHTPHTPTEPFASGMTAAAANGLQPVTEWQPFRSPGVLAFDAPELGGRAELYRGEVASVDRQIGRLLDALDRRGAARRTIVVVFADHGENLGEHGILYRHAGLFDTTTHVPLLMRRPGLRGERRAGLVQTHDLFPTLLRLAGARVEPSDGLDLFELTDAGRTGRREVYSEDVSGRGTAVRSRRHRYAEIGPSRFFAGGTFLFDLERDPREETNIAEDPASDEIRRALRDRLEAFRARAQAKRTPSDASSAEEAARLRALGYL